MKFVAEKQQAKHLAGLQESCPTIHNHQYYTKNRRIAIKIPSGIYAGRLGLVSYYITPALSEHGKMESLPCIFFKIIGQAIIPIIYDFVISSSYYL